MYRALVVFMICSHLLDFVEQDEDKFVSLSRRSKIHEEALEVFVLYRRFP